MNTSWTREYPSPLGTLTLESDGQALVRIQLPEETRRVGPHAVQRPEAAPFAEAVAQLDAYFAGERASFTLPLAPRGTDFQRQVWALLTEIPRGETITYGELARRLGNPAACRAVGAANGQNPLPIVIPCHRVIGSDGRLTGYAGGLDAKRALLALEGAPGTF